MHPRRPHRLLVVAALLPLLSGCSLLPLPRSAYDFLVKPVHARNEHRYDRAKRQLDRAGYEFTDAPRRASMDDDLRERCLDRASSPRRSDGAPDSVPLGLSKSDGGARAGDSGLEVRAPLDEACRFFAGTLRHIRVERPDGSHATVSQFSGRTFPARTPSQRWVRIQPTFRVIDRRTVLVIDTCNRMPTPRQHPLRDPRTHSIPVVLTDRPVPTVRMDVGREVIDQKCTRTTH